MNISIAVLDDTTGPLLTSEVLDRESSFAPFADETARRLVRVLKKYATKLPCGAVPPNELKALTALDHRYAGPWQLHAVLHPWDGDAERGLHISCPELGLSATCHVILRFIPRSERDWTRHWQRRLDTILVSVQALEMRNTRSRITYLLDKYRRSLISEGTIHPRPLGGPETRYGLRDPHAKA